MVPQARMPSTRVEAFGKEALQIPPTGVEARSLIVMDIGTATVKVLLIKSPRAERDLIPFGEIGQEQQATKFWVASNV